MSQPSLASLVGAANTEWTHWGRSLWNCITGQKSASFHRDDDTTYARYVIETYLPPFYPNPRRRPDVNAIANDSYFWSAVTISHFMSEAGYARKPLLPSKFTDAEYEAWVAMTLPDEFPISESHSQFIRWAIRAQRGNVQSAAYWGYRADDPRAVPDVGDIIGYARAPNLTRAQALKYFDRRQGYSSHSDLVVGRRNGEIDVIGGNVRDSVTRKTLAVDANGLLADSTHMWFVVMKRRH